MQRRARRVGRIALDRPVSREDPVLVLISFALVLVAAVLLVIGLLSDSGLGLIYVSIACSVVAGIVLVVATRVGRARPQAVGGTAPLAGGASPAVVGAGATATV